ncbi:hypothetical protein G7Y79_00024g054950 [Physcia stellaris]|nr:hypothetical protein G7Y79_00024g054950 [Physcia stellaris]
MLVAILLAHSALIVSILAATVPHPLPQESGLSLGASNAATNDSSDLVGAHGYGVIPTFSGPDLDQNSLLMSAVQLLAREALEDINGEMQRVFWRSRDSRYSKIYISVLPHSAVPTIKRAAVVWGLAESLSCMMDLDRFGSVGFKIVRRGEWVGTIEFTELAGNQYGSSGHDNQSRSLFVANTTAPAAAKTSTGLLEAPGMPYVDTPWLKAAGLEVFCRLHGYDLEPFDVFRPVVEMISHMAVFDSRRHVRSLETRFRIGTTAIRYRNEFRRSPPFFEAQHVIKATAILPAFMLNKGRLSETDIEVKVDGALVGRGQLKIERTPRPHLLNDASTA